MKRIFRVTPDSSVFLRLAESGVSLLVFFSADEAGAGLSDPGFHMMLLCCQTMGTDTNQALLVQHDAPRVWWVVEKNR